MIEKYLIEREKDNSDFNFMLFHGTEDNNYYRWRVYSYAQGDTDIFWREEPFQFNIGGNIWHPPMREFKYNSSETSRTKKLDENFIGKNQDNTKENLQNIAKVKSNDNNDEDEDEEENETIDDKTSHIGNKKLSDKSLAEFKRLLQHLSTKRYAIKSTMKFCYTYIQSAKQIIKILYESIINTRKLQEKTAKLYLISDILYNSTNVDIYSSWCFKNEIVNVLPEIFEDLSKTYSESIGRFLSESFKETILSLLKLWSKWNILESIYLEGLEVTFLKQSQNLTNQEIKSDSLIKSQLEIYEDELLDLCTSNPESLKYLAFNHGISSKGEISEIISKLVSLKEFKLRREFVKNEKIQQEKEIEKKMKENLIEMDKKIKHYKDVLISLQNSYKIINEFDVDGHPIEVVELDFLNLRDVNVAKEKEIKSITHVITIESNNIKENATTKYDDDLDGEPI